MSAELKDDKELVSLCHKSFWNNCNQANVSFLEKRVFILCDLFRTYIGEYGATVDVPTGWPSATSTC